jgi:hypothetical protein
MPVSGDENDEDPVTAFDFSITIVAAGSGGGT